MTLYVVVCAISAMAVFVTIVLGLARSKPPGQTTATLHVSSMAPEIEPTVEEVDSEAAESEPGLRIGGWLTLLALGLVLSPLAGIVNILQLLDVPVRSREPYGDELEAVDLVFVGVVVVLIAFTLFVAVSFFRRKRMTPGLLMILMFASLLCNLAVAGLNADFGRREDLVQQVLVGLPLHVLAIAIWVPYLIRSKRVRATFVR